MSPHVLTAICPLRQRGLMSAPTLRLAYQPARFINQDEYKDKQIVDKPTPYEKANRQCILCKNNIKLDYKNPRLISQFVSPLNGRLYEKHITGLCEKQQSILEIEHRKSTIAMYMPIFHKNAKYNKDTAIVNPDKPQRPNPH